ncbi:hypothetical protein GCM10028820_07840 [Tessaracoccus terricola]
MAMRAVPSAPGILHGHPVNTRSTARRANLLRHGRRDGGAKGIRESLVRVNGSGTSVGGDIQEDQ